MQVYQMAFQGFLSNVSPSEQRNRKKIGAQAQRDFPRIRCSPVLLLMAQVTDPTTSASCVPGTYLGKCVRSKECMKWFVLRCTAVPLTVSTATTSHNPPRKTIGKRCFVWVLPDLRAQWRFLLEMINSNTERTSSKHRVRELEGCFAESGKPGVSFKLEGRQPVPNNIWGMLSQPFTCEWESMRADSHRMGFTVLGKGRQRLLGQLLSLLSLLSVLLLFFASKPALRSLWRNPSRKIFSKAF